MRKWHLPLPYSPPTPLSYFGWYAQHGSPLPLADVNEVWRAASAGRTCAQSIIEARNSGFIDRKRPIKHVFALHPICWCNANKYIFHLEQTNSPIHRHLKATAHAVAAQSATKHLGFTKQTACIRDVNATESPLISARTLPPLYARQPQGHQPLRACCTSQTRRERFQKCPNEP